MASQKQQNGNIPNEHALAAGDFVNPPDPIKDSNKRSEVASKLRVKSDTHGTCRSIMTCIFGSRQLVSRHDREEYIKISLVELAIYSVYLTVACLITYGMTTSSSFYYTRVIHRLFLDTPLGKENRIDATTFQTSTSVEDFWKFAETTMVDGLHWKYWYGINEPGNEIPPKHQGVLLENRLLGRPRLRQLRVRVEPCPISEKFRRLFRECFPPYTEKYEEKNPFDPDLGTKDAWKYHEADDILGTPYWGRLATYSGGGAYQLLGSEDAETKQIINELKNKLWVTRATRVVFLDFTMYNANVNLFCIVKLVWEFPATGGVITSYQIRTIRLVRYVTPKDYFLSLLEYVFIGFTIYYTIQEIFLLIIVKCATYWSEFWNYLDLCILTLSYMCIGFSIFRYRLVSNELDALIQDPSVYINFYWLGFWETQYNNVVAVGMFLAWIKLFKYISFNQTMSQLTSTMSRCAKDIGGFAIMFFIVFFAFAQLGYLLFGSQVDDFRTFHDTVFALLRLILGDFDFRAIESANRILGPAFFLTYVFFVFFVLLNMFLAIINDTYSQVKSEVSGHALDFQVTDYIKRSFNDFLGTFGLRNKKIELETRVKLTNAQNAISVEELKEHLKQCNYSDVEIEMFVTKYDLDEEREIEGDEAEHIVGGLDGFHGSGRLASSFSGDQGVSPKVLGSELTETEISELQTRVGILESSLTGVTRKMDTLLRKLSSMESTAQSLSSKSEIKPSEFFN